MTHLRLWRFEVLPEQEARFVEAYCADGDWSRLFATAAGFLRTELWRGEDGAYLTADHWRSREEFDAFQADQGEQYRRLDAKLEGVAGVETFLGAYDLAS